MFPVTSERVELNGSFPQLDKLDLIQHNKSDNKADPVTVPQSNTQLLNNQSFQEIARQSSQKIVKDIEESDEDENPKMMPQQATSKNLTSVHFLTEYLRYLWPGFNIQNLSENLETVSSLQNDPQILSEIQNKLLANNSFIKCQKFTSDLLVHSVKSTKYSEIVNLTFQLGYFQTNALILNFSSAEKQSSPFHQCSHVDQAGRFGNIYLIKIQSQKLAIKCIKKDETWTQMMSSNHSNFQHFSECLKEWFLVKLVSQLQIGPKLKTIFGFDMILGADCLEFGMEVCEQLEYSQKDEQKLIEILKKLHALKIVHRDIKPNNLMWSSQFQTPVFIDFGGAIFIEQSLGQKSLTSFMGTAGFISPEMFSLLSLKNNYVDLYYNDMYGLMTSFAFKGKKTKRKAPQIKKIDLISNQNLLICAIKYKLFANHFYEAKRLLNVLRSLGEVKLESEEHRIAQFFIQLKPNKGLKQIYWWLDEEVRNMQRFHKLKNTYIDKFQLVFSTWTHYQFKALKFRNQIQFYHHLNIKLDKLSPIELQIEQILLSKQKVQKFLQSVKCKHRYHPNQSFSNQQILIYSLIALVCCTLAHNKFNFSLEEKQQIAKDFVKYVKNESKKPTFESLLFVCHLEEIQQIAFLLQYFLTEVWNFVPERFHQFALKYLISSLCLAGYPFYIYEAKHFLLYFILKKLDFSQQTVLMQLNWRIAGIIKFWQVMALIQIHCNIFYNRKQSNFMSQKQQIKSIVTESHSIQLRLMFFSELYNQQPRQVFLSINFVLYKHYIRVENQITNQRKIRKLLVNLKYNPEYGIDKKVFRQWKTSILFVQRHYQYESQREILQFINSFQSDIFLDNPKQDKRWQSKGDFSLHLTLFMVSKWQGTNYELAKKLLSITDEQIILPIFQDRFIIELRIYFAWINLDIMRIKKLVKVVLEDLQQFSVYNFQSLSIVLQAIVLISRLDKLDFWHKSIPNIIMIYDLESIITKALSYMQWFMSNSQWKKPILRQDISETKKNSGKVYLSQQYEDIQLYFNLQKQRQYSLQKHPLIYFYLENCIYKISFFKVFFLSQVRSHTLDKCEVDIIRPQLISNTKNMLTIDYFKQIIPQKFKKSILFSPQSLNKMKNLLIQVLQKFNGLEFSDEDLPSSVWNQKKTKILLQNAQGQDYWKELKKINEEYILLQLKKGNCKQDQVKIPPMYVYTKIMAKNVQNDIKSEDYEVLIKHYNYCKGQMDCFNFMFHTQTIGLLIEGYIKNNKTNQELYSLFIHITSLLNKYPYRQAIQVFKQALEKWFNEERHRQRTIKQRWSIVQFIGYVYQERKKLDPKQNPYMALFMYYAIHYSNLDKKIARSFLSRIFESLNCLDCSYKSIFYLIYPMSYDLLPFQKRIESLYNVANIQKSIQNVSSINKIRHIQSILRTQFYYVEKTLKTSIHKPINWLVEERFRIKKLRKPKWKIPAHIQFIYRKKLSRFHSVSKDIQAQNYKIEDFQQFFDQIVD